MKEYIIRYLSNLRPSSKKHVLLYAAYPWHKNLLLPLQKILPSSIEVIFREGDADLENIHPNIVVVADAGAISKLRKIWADAIYIHICHGLISKNQPKRYYAHADYICMPSQYLIEKFLLEQIKPIKEYWLTGFVQMDFLFQELSLKKTPQDARKSPYFPSNLNSDCPLVLYAPTWNEKLSSVDMLIANGFFESFWKDITTPNFSVIVKLHPHSSVTNPTWISHIRELSLAFPNYLYLAESDEHELERLIPFADVMVSDCSSAIFHFLSTERPQILINNPQRFEAPACFDPNGLEWRWRDLGITIDNAKDLCLAIQESFLSSNASSKIRSDYNKQFFGTLTDGYSAQRICTKLCQLLEL